MTKEEPERKEELQKKKDKAAEYFVTTWKFQKFLVWACLLPIPVSGIYLAGWLFYSGEGKTVPMLLTAVVIGSLGLHLLLGFLFWRCPACNVILFRTSDSGAAVSFWLADPDYCPDCGVCLVQNPQKKKKEYLPTPREKGEKY